MLGISRLRSITVAVIRAAVRARAAAKPSRLRSWLVNGTVTGMCRASGDSGSVPQVHRSAKKDRTSIIQS